MKVTELKAALSERGLDIKGNKAALVARLQAAIDEDDNDSWLNKTEDKGDHAESESVASGDEEDNHQEAAVEDQSGTNNGQEPVENKTEFESKEFVGQKPTGISFGLHQPTPVKPQPREAPRPVPAPAAPESGGRSGAAAYFAQPEGGQAAVPLPPSTGYDLDESEEDEDEAPPGLALPAVLDREPPQQQHSGVGEEEGLSWRPCTARHTPRLEQHWLPDTHIQDPVIFLNQEAQMAGEELVYEVEDNDIPGFYNILMNPKLPSYFKD